MKKIKNLTSKIKLDTGSLLIKFSEESTIPNLKKGELPIRSITGEIYCDDKNHYPKLNKIGTISFDIYNFGLAIDNNISFFELIDNTWESFDLFFPMLTKNGEFKDCYESWVGTALHLCLVKLEEKFQGNSLFENILNVVDYSYPTDMIILKAFPQQFLDTKDSTNLKRETKNLINHYKKSGFKPIKKDSSSLIYFP